MAISRKAKATIGRAAGIVLGIWLIVVLLAYIGVLQLKGMVADLALATVLIVIAGMIWKYLLRPLVKGETGAE